MNNDSVACRTTFSSNNCIFLINLLYDWCLFFTLMLQLLEVYGYLFLHSSLKIPLPLQHFKQLKIWTLTGPLQQLHSFLFLAWVPSPLATRRKPKSSGLHRADCWYEVLCLDKYLHFDFVCFFYPKAMVPEVFWFIQIQICKPELCSLLNKPYFSLFLTVFSWTSTFNMLAEACRIWAVALGFFCAISEHCTFWAWSEFAEKIVVLYKVT